MLVGNVKGAAKRCKPVDPRTVLFIMKKYGSVVQLKKTWQESRPKAKDMFMLREPARAKKELVMSALTPTACGVPAWIKVVFKRTVGPTSQLKLRSCHAPGGAVVGKMTLVDHVVRLVLEAGLRVVSPVGATHEKEQPDTLVCVMLDIVKLTVTADWAVVNTLGTTVAVCA